MRKETAVVNWTHSATRKSLITNRKLFLSMDIGGRRRFHIHRQWHRIERVCIPFEMYVLYISGAIDTYTQTNALGTHSRALSLSQTSFVQLFVCLFARFVGSFCVPLVPLLCSMVQPIGSGVWVYVCVFCHFYTEQFNTKSCSMSFGYNSSSSNSTIDFCYRV